MGRARPPLCPRPGRRQQRRAASLRARVWVCVRWRGRGLGRAACVALPPVLRVAGAGRAADPRVGARRRRARGLLRQLPLLQLQSLRCRVLGLGSRWRRRRRWPALMEEPCGRRRLVRLAALWWTCSEEEPVAAAAAAEAVGVAEARWAAWCLWPGLWSVSGLAVLERCRQWPRVARGYYRQLYPSCSASARRGLAPRRSDLGR